MFYLSFKLFSTFNSLSKLLMKRSFSSNGVMNDIKVLDLTRIVAGPYCTMILGDLGAEIIKIEQPGTGDETRLWPPYTKHDGNLSCYFSSVNRNKKSVCVNLKSSEGKNIIYELSRKCDVLVENYVPGKLASLGLGYETLSKMSPHLIYCSLSGYGYKGPYKNRPGYDVIAASEGGLLHITGPKNGEPCKTGVAMTDIATGLYAYGAILAALLERTKSGLGQKIDCNLLSTQIACLINIGNNYLNAGIEGNRWGTAHESIVPYESFETSDGYITIGAASNSQFKSLCKKLELDSLITDERFLTNELRVRNRLALIDILKPYFKLKTTSYLMELFEGSPFPHGPVNTISQVFDDPHVKEIGLVEDVSNDGEPLKLVGPPVEFSSLENRIRSPPPYLGQHTKEVLMNILHYSGSKIENLSQNGVIQCEDVTEVKLTLRKPKSDKGVKWSTDTVDNEHLNKKKSKCCCIYEKPRNFGESSSESEGECENCFGHVEIKRKKKDHKTSEVEQSAFPVQPASPPEPDPGEPSQPADDPSPPVS